MPLQLVTAGVLSANSAGPAETSVTIGRSGGAGWAFADTSLVWSRDLGRAFLWISAARIQRSADQIDNVLFGGPDGAQVVSWFQNCLSVTFSLRVVGTGRASAAVKLYSWQ
jgi:hypothetical protein